VSIKTLLRSLLALLLVKFEFAIQPSQESKIEATPPKP